MIRLLSLVCVCLFLPIIVNCGTPVDPATQIQDIQITLLDGANTIDPQKGLVFGKTYTVDISLTMVDGSKLSPKTLDNWTFVSENKSIQESISQTPEGKFQLTTSEESYRLRKGTFSLQWIPAKKHQHEGKTITYPIDWNSYGEISIRNEDGKNGVDGDQGVHGKHGTADSFRGENGTNGGGGTIGVDGDHGPDITIHTVKVSDTNGQVGMLVKITKEGTSTFRYLRRDKIKIVSQGGHGGNGGKGGDGGNGGDGYVATALNISGYGGHGGEGGYGGNGGQGGNGGKITAYLTVSTKEKVVCESIAGKGGKAGMGGVSGKGGKGEQKGKDGTIGQNGEAGTAGVSGKVERHILEKNSMYSEFRGLDLQELTLE